MGGVEQAVREWAVQRVGDLATAFVQVVRDKAPRRTGELADSVEVDDVSQTGDGATAHVVVGAPYASYVDEGTGIYGPLGTPIVPVTAKVLVFPATVGPRAYVFTPYVLGSEPTHFWSRALEDWPSIVASL
jgi:hypothetical protein